MELIRFDDVDFSYLSDEEENHEEIEVIKKLNLSKIGRAHV